MQVVLSKYLEYLPEIERLHPELGLQQCHVRRIGNNLVWCELNCEWGEGDFAFVLSATFSDALLQDSDGLIVAGRSLDHFEVTKVLDGSDVHLYHSHFLDQQCVLKVLARRTPLHLHLQILSVDRYFYAKIAKHSGTGGV